MVGWTGSGKSTLIRLLVRLYDVTGGQILLDGVDVREREPRELRQAVGVVSQDPFLFSGAFATTSRSATRVDEERILRAAKVVDADRFIGGSRGATTPRCASGARTSPAGEKQLLSFARALAFDPAVLVLDEATASIDPATEQRIQAALRTLLEDRTSIVIAHRLVTLREMDRILVLHHGRLHEQGTHEELLQIEGGIYRMLHELQSAV